MHIMIGYYNYYNNYVHVHAIMWIRYALEYNKVIVYCVVLYHAPDAADINKYVIDIAW